MEEFEANNLELAELIAAWEPKLMALSKEITETRRNLQDRNIKQIVGHMVDSASNNTHRLVHFQYQPNPMVFPDYGHLGNNDRWIAIQHYETENWHDLVKLWRYTNLHIIHVIENMDITKLDHEWITAIGTRVSMKEMVLDYLTHFKLHIREITELIDRSSN